MREWMSGLFAASTTAGLLILLLAAAGPLLNRQVAARWKYWVWLVLALRLLIPLDLSLPAAPLRLPLPAFQASAALQAEPGPGSNGKRDFPPAASAASNPQPEKGGQISPDPGFAAAQSPSPFDLLGLLWLTGVVGAALYQTLGAVAFRRRLLRWARPPKRAETTALFQAEKLRLGLEKNITLLISQAAPGPLLLGPLRPVVVLPCEEYTPADLQLVLRHELTHCKQGDLWYKLTLLAAAVLHWFNPLAWLLLREADADLELRCDDAVLKGADGPTRRAYSETILAAIHRQRLPHAALSTYFHGSRRRMQRRFENILAPPAHRRGALLPVFTLAAAAGLAVLVGCGPTPQGLAALSGKSESGGLVSGDYQTFTVDFTSQANARAEMVFPENDGPPTIVCRQMDGSAVWEQPEAAVQLQLQLPRGWQLRPAKDGETCWAGHLTAPYNLFDQAGQLIGTLGYNTYFEGQISEAGQGDDFYGVGYRARYYWIMNGFLSWDNRYLAVKTDGSRESAACRVSYTAQVSPTGQAMENDGILAYDDALLRYVALELADGASTAAQRETIAASMQLFAANAPDNTPPTPAPALVPQGFARQSLTFPAYGGWETEFNREIYNAAPFVTTLALPEGFSFQIPADASQVTDAPEDFPLWCKVPILREGKAVGAILYNLYEPLPAGQAGDNPRMVYSAIMAANHMGWDFDYTPVSRTATAGSATCLAGFHAELFAPPADPSAYLWEDGGENGWDMWYKKGVLSHDDTLGVYVALYFDYSALTDEQLRTVAESIILSPAAN